MQVFRGIDVFDRIQTTLWAERNAQISDRAGPVGPEAPSGQKGYFSPLAQSANRFARVGSFLVAASAAG